MKAILFRAGLAATLVVGAASLRYGVPRALAHGDDDHKDEQKRAQFVYAAKVYCPTSGTTTTTINVHNPDKKTQTVTKEGIALDVGQVPAGPGTPVEDTLKADFALQMGCADLTTLGAVGPAGFGDVILKSSRALDVWAVYLTGSRTGEGGVNVTSTEVVRVPASRHQGAGEGDDD